MISKAETRSSKCALVAALLTILFVAPFEIVSFYRGEYPGYYIGVLGVPLIIALIAFSTVRGRIIAWVLLTAVSLLTSLSVMIALWFA
jgi:hypothetical protein